MSCREVAIDELSRHGITGGEVYLIDIIPVIKMMWADGSVHSAEFALLDRYLEEHIAHINGQVGYEMMTFDKAKKFVARFLTDMPSKSLLDDLTALFERLHRSMVVEDYEAIKQSLLYKCIDMAAVREITGSHGHPFEPHSNFELSEKKCLFEIMDLLEAGSGKKT